MLTYILNYAQLNPIQTMAALLIAMVVIWGIVPMIDCYRKR
jgi:hypothetical protein